MTPSDRVEAVLRGERVRPVPFTIYECMIPQCRAEREMRNRGMCIVERTIPVFTSIRPNVKTTQETFQQDGKRMVRTRHETPHGVLETLDEPIGFTSWHHQRMFKTPDDYRALEFYIRDEHVEADYSAFLQAQRHAGGDLILRAAFGLEPLQSLMSGPLMAMEDFCIQWMDHRDDILRLYEALVEKRRATYVIVAKSPAQHANYGGNVVPQIIGKESFREYYLPHYNEAAEVMHAHGKLVGCHFDGDNRLISDAIADTDLDYIEAFTPAPDTDMSLAEARAAWPNKILWLNFPSSIHLKTDEEVEQATVDLLGEVDSTDGVIMGITEDMPPDRWRDSCRAIMAGLERDAEERPRA